MKSGDGTLAQISAAEWQIMECLWANGPMYMADMVACLKDKTEWSRTTVLTLASRLEAKAFIGTERSNKAYLYVPMVNRKTALQDRLDNFVKETLAGDYYALAKIIVEGAKLTVAEEKKLRARFKPAKEETEQRVAVSQAHEPEEPLAQRKLEYVAEKNTKIKNALKSKAKSKDKEKEKSDKVKEKKNGKKPKKK